MIALLKEMTSYSIRMSIVRIPPGKRFSICLNGARRTCAIVQVSNSIFTKYIIEIARPDDWLISTQVLEPMREMTLKEVEHELIILLDGLVQKSGHWDQHVLDRCITMKIKKVKHYQRDFIRNWVQRVIQK